MIDYLVLCTVSIIFQPYNGKIILEHCELCFDYFDDTELYTGHVISEDREERQEESEDRWKEPPQLPASISRCIITYFRLLFQTSCYFIFS